MTEKRNLFYRLLGRALRSVSIVTLIVVVLLSSLILLPQAKAVEAAGLSYFLDAASGSDANNGRSEATAWKTIAKVNAAALLPGDSVLLKRGQLWQEKLIAPASGSESSPITFSAYGSGSKPVIDGAGVRKTIDAQGRSYLVFEGLEIRNSSSYSIHFWGDADGHNVVRNCTITGGADAAILSQHNDNNLFEGNEISGMDGCGILFTTSGGSSVLNNIARNNTISFCANYGIGLHAGDTASRASGNTVTGNTLHDNGDGIYLIRADHNTVTGNISYHNTNVTDSGEGYGIGIEASSLNLISSNDLYGNRNHGIEVWGGISPVYKNSDSNLILRNRIHDNTLRGIFFSSAYSNNNQVSYNLVYDNLQSNVVIYHPNSGNQLYNNVLDGSVNGRGLAFDSDAAGWDVKNNVISNSGDYLLYAAPGTAVSHANNCFYQSGADVVSFNGALYTMATLGSYESSAKASDPSFQDRAGHDFRLQSSSSLIDQGTSVGLTADFASNPIVALPEIGSYEMQAAAPTPTPTPTPTPEPTPVLSLQNLTAAPSTDVSSWNPVVLSADSPASGTWSVRVFNAAGNDVTSAGTLTLSPNSSTVLSASWAPNSYYASTGLHTAQVQVSDGSGSQSASVSFSLYNFPLKVTGWHFLNGLGAEITSPKAGEAFYLTLELRNISNATLPKAFVPLMLSGRFLNAAEVQGMAPGQSVTLTLMGGALPAGSYSYQSFVWTGSGGTPIAQPASIPVVVIP